MNTRLKVLYVDNNTIIAESIHARLSRSVRVDQANSGLTAFDMVRIGEYDLVISGVSLPGIDGLELLRRVNTLEMTLRPPFLFVTGTSDEEIRRIAFEEGALDYIIKPFNEMELCKKIENILRFKVAVCQLESVRGFERLKESAAAKFQDAGLTQRQIEIALLLLHGKSKKDISSALKIAIATTKRHIENIYLKLSVQDRYQLFYNYYSSFQSAEGEEYVLSKEK